jgi:hypothetical protein
MRIASIASLGAAFVLLSQATTAQPVEVTYGNGLVSIKCKDATLSSVFERIAQETGIELTLEDEVKSRRLSANLVELPVSMAVSRLLEGAAVNYVVMMDPSDWGRVAKIFVGGGGGGGGARAAAPVRPAPRAEPPEEAYEEAPPESFDETGEAAADVADPGLDESPEDVEDPEEFAGEDDPNAFPPPGSSPLPDFLPPAQQFPRSSFTPGLPNRNQRPQTGTAQQPQQQDPGNAPPPATFPFTDPFGRPIPIPPGMNQQQQQNRQKRQQQ